MADHELPPLPYDYDALEPALSEQVLTWHHDTHHQGYVNGLNSAEETLAENREEGDFGSTPGAPQERHPQRLWTLSPHAVLGEHVPNGGGGAGGRPRRPHRGGLRLLRGLEGRVRGRRRCRRWLGTARVRPGFQAASQRRGRQARPGRTLGLSPHPRAGRLGNTPTTTTTDRTAETSSTPSSTSSTGRRPKRSTRPASATSSRAVDSKTSQSTRIFSAIDGRQRSLSFLSSACESHSVPDSLDHLPPHVQ